VVAKAVVRRVRFLGRSPRGVASACRRDLAGFLADQGRPVPLSATPREVGTLAEEAFGVDAAPFVEAVDTARYGTPTAAAGGSRRARVELRRLRRRISGNVGLAGRVRGALSLRSLGA
jgi:hypothetical protein